MLTHKIITPTLEKKDFLFKLDDKAVMDYRLISAELYNGMAVVVAAAIIHRHKITHQHLRKAAVEAAGKVAHLIILVHLVLAPEQVIRE
jgi:hypothetical protein